MKKISAFLLTEAELNALIANRAAKCTNNPDRYAGWDSIDEFNWSNAYYMTRITETSVTNYYLDFVKDDIMAGDKVTLLTTMHYMFVFMYENNIIEKGTYIIDATR